MKHKKIQRIFILLLVTVLMSAFVLPGMAYASESVQDNSFYSMDFLYSSITGNPIPFNGATDCAFDSHGNMYVSDYGNNRIVVFDITRNFLRAFGSAGSGVGQFNKPSGIAVDQQDWVYVADTFNNKIVSFKDVNGNGSIETDEWKVWGGTAGSGSLQFNKPMGVLVKGSNVYVADTYNHRIDIFDSANPEGTWSSFGSNGTGSGQFKAPYDVAVDTENNIWVSDTFNNRVQKFDAGKNYIASYASNYPYGLLADKYGNVFAAERQTGYIRCLNDNQISGGKGNSEGLFISPIGIGIDPISGMIHVVDVSTGKIQWAISPYAPAFGDISVKTVLPDGSPSVGANVTVTISSTGDSYTDITDQNGIARFLHIQIGENFIVNAVNGAYKGSIQGFIPESQDTADFTINMAIPGTGMVTGSVNYDTGEIAANVVATVQFAETNATASTMTDANGQFTLAGLPTDGSFMLTAFDPVSAASGTAISYITQYNPHSWVQVTIKKPITVQPEFTNSDFSTGTLEGWEASENVMLVPKNEAFPEDASDYYPSGILDSPLAAAESVQSKPADYSMVAKKSNPESDIQNTRAGKSLKKSQSLAMMPSIQSAAASAGGYSAIVTTAGDSVAEGTLNQTFNITPEQSGVLKGRIRFVSDEWPTWYGTQYNDSYIVKLITPGGTTVLAKGNLNSSAWKPGVAGFSGATDEIKVSVDVSAYVGQAVTLSVVVSDVGDMVVDSGVVVSDFKIITGELTVFSTPTDTHSFISIKNTSKANMTVGVKTVGPGKEITIGTWGNKDAHAGVWYNLEAYFINNAGAYVGRVSLDMEISSDDLKKINAYIKSHDYYGVMNANCSNFAAGTWNTVSDKQVSPSGTIVSRPSILATSIQGHSGYKTNKAVQNVSDVEVGFQKNSSFYVPSSSSWSSSSNGWWNVFSDSSSDSSSGS